MDSAEREDAANRGDEPAAAQSKTNPGESAVNADADSLENGGAETSRNAATSAETEDVESGQSSVPIEQAKPSSDVPPIGDAEELRDSTEHQSVFPSAAAHFSAEEVRSTATRLMREGRFSEASDLLSDWVRESRDDGEAWRLLGGALSSLGDTEAAVVAFAEALRCRPTEPRSHYNLALALERSGARDAAKDRYAACLAIDPTHAGALERCATLGRSVSEVPPVSAPVTEATDIPAESPVFPTASEPSERRLAPPIPMVSQDGSQPSSANPGRSSRWGETPASEPGPPRRPDSPPATGQGQAQLPKRPLSAQESELQASTIFALGIVGVAGGMSCGLPLLVSPVAWIMANHSFDRLKKMDDVDPAVRNQLQAGKVLGIVGTVLLGFVMLAVLAAILIGVRS